MKPSRIVIALSLVLVLMVLPTGRSVPRMVHADYCGEVCIPIPSSLPNPKNLKQSWPCVSVSVNVGPPPGFAPLAATDLELRCWGFPSRPRNARDLAGWTHAMQQALTWVPPVKVQLPASIVHPASAGPCSSYYYGSKASSCEQSQNWAGYTANRALQSTRTAFYDVAGEWNVPDTYGTTQKTIASWVGLGGDYGDGHMNLDQAGTYSVDDGKTTTQFFYEDYPDGAVADAAISVAPQDVVFVECMYNGDGTSTYYFQNETTGTYDSVDASTPHAGGIGESAEWITELPNFGDPNGTGYIDFSPTYFAYSYAEGTASDGSIDGRGLSQFTSTTMVMVKNVADVFYAMPSAVNSDDDSFAVCRDHC